MFLSVFSIGTLSFLLLELIPGEPETTILGIEASAKDLENLREQLGLNLSFGTRYWNWLCGVFQGDLGISFKYKEPVFKLILERLPLTLKIAFISIFIIFLVSIPLSFFLHNTKNKRIKKIGESIFSLFISIPSFWLGIIFMYLFGIILKWTSTGYNNSWQSLILPCLVISIPKIGCNGMKKIYLNFYILKNAFLPIIPLTGMLLLELITGVVIIEQIFSIPGIGRLLVQSVLMRDIPLIQGLIFYTSTFVVLLNFVIDILYSLLDPRIQVGDQ